VDGQFTDVDIDICPRVDAFELSKFASWHNLALVACEKEINQIYGQQIEPLNAQPTTIAKYSKQEKMYA